MLSVSRDALLRRVESLRVMRQSDGFAGLAAELFAAADLLAVHPRLRNAVADGGRPAVHRVGLTRDVFASRVSELALGVLLAVAEERWSSADDVVTAIEELAATAAFTLAEDNGTLESVEEELFLFGRAVDSSAELQMALTDPAGTASSKAAIVRDLLAGRVNPVSSQVLEYTVGHLRGVRIDSAVENLGTLAAHQRQRILAEVRVAAPLTQVQESRLTAALTALKGRTVRLNVAVDPEVLGGVYVKVGDEVIDGTVASRLQQARRVVLG